MTKIKKNDGKGTFHKMKQGKESEVEPTNSDW